MKLGNLVQSAGLNMKNIVRALKFGVGAGAFPFVYGALQSKLLLKASPTMFAQNTPGEYAARGLSGIILGGLVATMVKQPEIGIGMTAMAVGLVLKDIVAGFMSPSASAAQAVVKAEEQATGVGQMSGVNPMGTGLAGLGYGSQRDQSMLFGAGTPDMSANRMFNGATVAIEEHGFSGATVAIERSPSFAGALS